MDPLALVRDLAAIEGRSAGSDAERRAARLLARRLRDQGRDPRTETFWLRPSWQVVHAILCAAAVAGSVVAVDHPVTGTAILGAALVLFAGDLSGRLPLLRRLTLERASQNVVAPAPLRAAGSPSTGEPGAASRRRRRAEAADVKAPGAVEAPAPRRAKAARRAQAEAQAQAQLAPAPRPVKPPRPPRVTLVLTAAVDAPRVGAGDRGGLAPAQERMRRIVGGLWPGLFGWALMALVVLIVVGAARVAGAEGTGPGLVALLPTAVLILLFGHFVDAAVQEPGPGANANASAAAALLAIAEQIDADPPRELSVEVVLAGGDGAMASGMRRHLQATRRGGIRAEQVAVVHVHACGEGTPVWWTREGLVFVPRYHARMRALAAEVAAGHPELYARAHEGRGTSGARAARALRWPAIAIGAVDARGVAPRAGQDSDAAEAVDPQAIQNTVAFAIAFIRRLDDDLSA